MDDYISRQAALDLDLPPKHLRQYQTIVALNLDDAYEDGWYDFQTELLHLPPADVRPVRRGRWESHGEGFNWVFICSICGYIDGYPFNDRMNFCPNCGAQMGGDAG